MKTILNRGLFGRIVGVILSLLFAVACARADFQFSTIAGPPNLAGPDSVAVDGSGNIYVGESNRHVILKISPAGVVSIFAGLSGSSGAADGTGTSARFNYPTGLAVDNAGNVYVADRENSAIRKITPAGEVTTFAGGNGGALQSPCGVAVDAAGYVYVADAFHGLIQKITPAGVVSTFAGVGGFGIAVASGGTVYVTSGFTIRKVTSAGTVTILAGADGSNGIADGVGASAQFTSPRGVVVDNLGNVYVIDFFVFSIRKITADGTVTTIAGSSFASGNVDGSPTVVRFRTPSALALDGAGSFYVADTGNNSIRKGTRAPTLTGQPATQSAVVGSPVTFSVSATNDSPLSYQWGKAGVAIAGATSSTYTISSVTLGDAGDYSVVVSDLYSSATSATAVLIVGQTLVAPTFIVQPVSSAIFAGYSKTFVAEVIGTPTPTYQWQKNGINIAGATNPTLTLASIQLSAAGSYALVATNSAGSVTSRFARLVVLVQQPNAIMYDMKTSPTGVTPGANVNLKYELTNIGTRNWGSNHYLSIRDSNGIFVGFSSLIGTLRGETTTATLSFNAPITPGTYTYNVQALENGVEFFSTQTTLTLTVLAPLVNSITYNTTTFPVRAAPGSNVVFTYNVTNTGTQTWGANHLLSLRDSTRPTISSALLTTLAPGNSKTVNLSFTTPTAPGTYNYTVHASETGVGDFNTHANLTLVVLAPQPNAIVYNRVRYPDEVVPGAVLNLKYTLSNAGTQSWGAGHYVSLRDSNETYLAFIPLSGTSGGATKTVEFTFTTPTTPGTYTYYVQALEDGIEFFSTQDVVIVKVVALPLGNAISYNTSTIPVTAAPGATVNFTANVTNRGTRTWGATHYLSFRDVDDTFLAFPSLNGVAPGASRTSNLSFTAPTTPGIYTYTLQAFEDGVSFFEMADSMVLLVQ